MPIMVSTVFAKSAVLPEESAHFAVKSIEDEIAKAHFHGFNSITVEDLKKTTFETALINAVSEAENYIYEKHYKQQKFIKQKLEKGKTVSYYDLDMASRDEKEQPYVVIYHYESGKQLKLYAAYGCGTNGKSFDPNKGSLNKQLLIKDGKSHPLLTQQLLTNVIAAILPEKDCEHDDDLDVGSYKKYSKYDLPIRIYDENKNHYATFVGEYQGYGSGYEMTKRVIEENSFENHLEDSDNESFAGNEIILLDDHDDFEIDEDLHKLDPWETSAPKSSASNQKISPPLLTDLFSSADKNNIIAPMPQKFLCALTQKVMEDPVRVTGSIRGKFPLAYEKNALEDHFDDHGFGEDAFQQIMPDLALKREITDFLNNHPEHSDQFTAHKMR